MADFFQPILPKVGDVVLLQKTIATVMYIGPVHWNTDINNKNTLYVGLELPDEIANGHNGTYDNMIYFKCRPKHGIILPITTIIKIISPKELLNKLSAFKAEVNILNIETAKLRQKLSNSKCSQINDIVDDDDTKQKEMSDNKMIDINELNEIKKENQEYKAKIDALEIQKNEISNKLNVVDKEKENEINNCQKLTETLNIKQTQIEQLIAENNEMQKQKNLISDKLNVINEEKENEIHKLTETLSIKQAEIEQLITDNDEIQKQKNVLISEHYNSENQHKKETNDLLEINENQQNEMKEKDKKYQTKIEEMETELNEQTNGFETEITEIKQENNSLTQQLNDCDSKIKEMERESLEIINNLNAKYDGDILKLKNLLNEEKKKETDLKLKNSKIKRKLKNANKEKDNLLILYERKAKETEVHKVENKNLEKEVESHKRELRKMLKKLNQNTSNTDIKSPRSVIIQSMDQ